MPRETTETNQRPVTPFELSLAIRAKSLLLRRKREALRHYAPLPGQLAFHRSRAQTRIVGGSNQSGKSQAAAAEVAWILTGTHPFHGHLPKTDGLLYAVGYDEKHIQNLMWPKLAHEGAIRLIKDERNGEWRDWRPWQEYDVAYREKTAPAAPFLPEREIKEVSWHSKKDDCPSIVRMKNGWILHLFTSKGYPQKGTQIHAYWIDEEVEKDGWYAELQARSMRFGGMGFWSATPEISTPQFFRLFQQAGKQQENLAAPVVEKFWLQLDDNPYITDEQKAAFKASLPERLVRVKYYGEFAIAGLLVYPEFSRKLHCVQAHVIPPNWTRYMVVDPGVSVCAVLFAAVPPEGQEVHIYKELYIKRCSASIFGHEVAQAMGEYRKAFETFIIDYRMGRQTELGSGKTVVRHYSDALDEHGIACRATGSNFIAGNADIQAREESLRSWLEINPRTKNPVLRIHEQACPNLLWEMDQQFYDKSKGEVTDKKRLDKDNHIVTCLEYLASYDPGYHAPPTLEEFDNDIEVYLQEKRERQLGRSGSDSIRLGPCM